MEFLLKRLGGDTPFARFLRDYFSSRVAALGFVLLAIIAVLAIAGPFIAPQNPYDLAHLDVMDSRLEPGKASMDGNITYWLGTDQQGRDMLSAILYGIRISVAVGLISTIIALALGLTLGLLAGYVGGRTEIFIMRLADIQLSFPPILIALILLALTGQGVGKIITALVAVQWAYYARTARSAALVERKKEYIEAATLLGLSRKRIMFRHLLPNCLPPLIVIAALQIASAISLEATLSFLGLGSDGAVARPAHLQRLPVPPVGQLLDQLLPGTRAAGDHRLDQPGRRPVARRAQPAPADAMTSARTRT